MKKVILIGIDGATPDLLYKWINEKHLPTFSSIRRQGSWGHLKSTMPPFSAPAWTSIITGCNPGKHGIYGFQSTGTLKPRLINSRYRKVPAIWNYLSQLGLTNIIVNVPGSYPPEKIRGVMITGLLTPSFNSTFTYPPSLKKRLNQKDLGEYLLEHFWLEDFSRSRMKQQAPEKLLDLIAQQIKSRAEVSLNLMKSMSWDFSMIVFRGTDTAQHFLFHRKDLLLQCYQQVDTHIKEIINNYPHATCIIVSDHGFESIKGVLYPDNVLYNNGFLTPNQDPLKSYSALIATLFFNLIQKLISLLSVRYLQTAPKLKQLLLSSTTNLINFDRTKAFSTADGRGIQIALKTQYPSGIVTAEEYSQLVQDIKSIFLNLKHPRTSENIIKAVFSAEEIYGKDAIDPPDLIFELEPGITANEWLRYPKTIKEYITTRHHGLSDIFIKDALNRSGDHAQYGIFLAKSDSFKQHNKLSSIRVEDIIPIILTEMNIPIPRIITGSIPSNLFRKEKKSAKVMWDDYIKKIKVLSPTEIEHIKKLRSQSLK